MDEEPYIEQSITRVVLGTVRNAERPSHAVDLLQEAIDYLESRGTDLIDGRQPYLVRHVDIDFHEGCITFYLAPNEEG